MQGKIVIELNATRELPDSGSALPDLAHDAYFIKKELPQLSWSEGEKERSLGDKYEVTVIQARGVTEP
jgi:hypothetical protein